MRIDNPGLRVAPARGRPCGVRSLCCDRYVQEHGSGYRVTDLTQPLVPRGIFFNSRFSILDTQSAKGFTLIELVVVMSIVVFFATAFLNRVWFYQEQAEKTAMVEVAAVIQSELTMRYGHLLIRNEESKTAALATDNPMNWLAKAPRNYAGEFYDPQPDSVIPGNWMFDLKSRELIYVPARTDYFSPGASGQNWIRYRVRLMYEPASVVRGKAVVGVLFEPVEPYRWFD